MPVHLSIACGSLMEIETHLQIAVRLDYIDETLLHHLLGSTNEIGRMLNVDAVPLSKTCCRSLTTDHRPQFHVRINPNR
jgi:23S rRNA-intervening sequence protein